MGRTRHPDEPGEPHPEREPGETGDRGEGQEDKGGGKKKIDLTLSQVAGAGGATLTAATAASYLDVYGTVIGTAVMAVLSTAASPLLSHWFSRSGEQAKHLAEKAVVPKVRTAGSRGTSKTQGATAAGGTVTITGLEQAATGTQQTAPGEEPDATRTMAMPILGADIAQADREATRVDGNEEEVDPEETVLMPAQTQAEQETSPHTPARTAGDGTGDEPESVDEEAPTPRRRGWRAVLIPAALVFTAVMLVILAFELLTGRSLTSWTRGLDEPTSPSIMGGNSVPAQEEELEPEPEPEAPATEEPSVEDPGVPEQQPTQEPEQGWPEEPGNEQPEGGSGTDGDGGGGQPTPDPGGQEGTPPTEEQPDEEPGGSVPPQPRPGDDGQGGQVPEQQSD